MTRNGWTHDDYLREQARKAIRRHDNVETFAGSFVPSWREEARKVFRELSAANAEENLTQPATDSAAPEVAA